MEHPGDDPASADIQKAERLYGQLRHMAESWLQRLSPITGTFHDLLIQEVLHQVSYTDLGKLFQALAAVLPDVAIRLFSYKDDPDRARTYFVEVGPRDGREPDTLTVPLHPALTAERGAVKDVRAFFDYVFMRAALLQIILDEERERAPDEIEAVYRHFYNHVFAVSEQEEDHMDHIDQIDHTDYREDWMEPREMETAPEPVCGQAEEDFAPVYKALEELDGLLQVMYYSTQGEARSQLKALKAEAWEVQMQLDGGEAENGAIKPLLGSVLSLECERVDDANRLIRVAQTLLQAI